MVWTYLLAIGDCENSLGQICGFYRRVSLLCVFLGCTSKICDRIIFINCGLTDEIILDGHLGLFVETTVG